MDLHAENVFLNFERQENGEFVVSKVRLIDFGLTLHVPAQTPLNEGIKHPTYDDPEATFHNEFDIFNYSAFDILEQLAISNWGGGELKRSVVTQFLGAKAQGYQIDNVLQLNQEN